MFLRPAADFSRGSSFFFFFVLLTGAFAGLGDLVFFVDAVVLWGTSFL